MIIGGAAAVEQADRQDWSLCGAVYARPWLRFEVQLANELGHARSEVAGKIPVYVGDLDNSYLNLAAYQFEEMTKALQNRPCDCEQNQGDNINLNVATGEVTY